MESGRNPFYCANAAEIFLGKESVNLFIGHPPYFQTELEGNGGDPAKQMQNADTLEQYQERLLAAVKHMEHALKPDGHIFIAVPNHYVGLGIISQIENNTSLRLLTIRMWDYSKQFEEEGNHTVLFLHFTKNIYAEFEKAPFILTNIWHEAIPELDGYGEYVVAGTAPKAIYKEMIENYSRPGETVADLFAGSGTVCLVAMELDRKFIYNDVSVDRIIMAKKRIDDAYEAFFGQQELRS